MANGYNNYGTICLLLLLLLLFVRSRSWRFAMLFYTPPRIAREQRYFLSSQRRRHRPSSHTLGETVRHRLRQPLQLYRVYFMVFVFFIIILYARTGHSTRKEYIIYVCMTDRNRISTPSPPLNQTKTSPTAESCGVFLCAALLYDFYYYYYCYEQGKEAERRIRGERERTIRIRKKKKIVTQKIVRYITKRVVDI